MSLLADPMLRLLALLLLALASCAPAAAATVTGTATYRERIALPPDARFEAVILDTARADAPGRVLARTVVDHPGQPPIAFSLSADHGKIDPRARYALRATITVDGKLWFTTDRIYPVTPRDGFHADVLLRRVGRP